MDDASPDASPAHPDAITDPWHSRPLDVHRWSDHKELVAVVDWVWHEYCADLDLPGKAGPKPKKGYRDQLRVLLLDLYVAWLEDPTLCIGVSLSYNNWPVWSRYNALHISKKIIALIHRLVAAGLIVEAKGSYGGDDAMYNRLTRIRAATPLRERFQAVKATRDDVWQVAGQECIILKRGLGDDSRPIEYDDTAETHRMRAELLAYNALIEESFIDIPRLEDPWVTRPDGKGGLVKVLNDRHHQFTRRIFSRERWDLNGRFYGPWWQLIDGGTRRDIFINDTPTAEVDFRGLHLAIIAAEKGVTIGDDAYALPELVVPGAKSLQEQREVIKALILPVLNARSPAKAFASFRDDCPIGSPFKSLTNAQLAEILGVFQAHYPYLEGYLGQDHGIRLMNIDARIAERVLAHFTKQGVPVLCVHDSFIIDFTRVVELKQVMADAAKEIVGRALPLADKSAGWDEVLHWPDDVVLDFRRWSEAPRCDGYLKRLARWEALKQREVVPYRLPR